MDLTAFQRPINPFVKCTSAFSQFRGLPHGDMKNARRSDGFGALTNRCAKFQRETKPRVVPEMLVRFTRPDLYDRKLESNVKVCYAMPHVSRSKTATAAVARTATTVVAKTAVRNIQERHKFCKLRGRGSGIGPMHGNIYIVHSFFARLLEH